MSINMGSLKGGKLYCELNDVAGENEFVSALKNKVDYNHLAIEVRRLIKNVYFKEFHQGMLKFWVKTLLELKLSGFSRIRNRARIPAAGT